MDEICFYEVYNEIIIWALYALKDNLKNILQISNQIISFCDNISNIIKGDLSIGENGVASSFTHAFAVLIINSDFKSESVSEFANEFFNKCIGESKDFQETQKRKAKLQRSITIVGESKG